MCIKFEIICQLTWDGAAYYPLRFLSRLLQTCLPTLRKSMYVHKLRITFTRDVCNYENVDRGDNYIYYVSLFIRFLCFKDKYFSYFAISCCIQK